MITEIQKLFLRDIDRLAEEVRSFPPEKLWNVSADVSNSAGNLCLHLCGNLNHFIGHILGQTAYTRNRDFEFNATGLSKEELLQEVSAAKEVVSKTLSQISAEDLNQTFPLEVLGYEMTTGYFLVHLSGHLNYHLGQINYLRRLI